jgi:translation elongation factor EF-1alpha
MGDNPYHKEEPITFKCATQEVEGRIKQIYRCFDPATIELVEQDAKEIGAAEIAEVEIALERPAVVDSFTDIPEMGRFVIEDGGHPVAGGIII